MQIGELARLTGCAVDTIRYYEKQALLPPPARSAGNFRDYAEMDWVSTRTPTPMVDDTATLRKYTPLLEAGLALVSASMSAARLPLSWSESNERRPMVE